MLDLIAKWFTPKRPPASLERTYPGGMRVSDLYALVDDLEEDWLRDPIVRTRRSRGSSVPVTSVRSTRGGDLVIGSEEWPA